MVKILLGKGRFYDLLHKGAVGACMVCTVIAMSNIGTLYTNLFTKRKVKPKENEELEVIESGQEVQKA